MSAIRPGKRAGGRTFTFHHITLRVTDLRRARAFYEGVLGPTVDQDFPDEKRADPVGPAMVTFRDPDNIQWEIFEQV